MGGLNSSVRMWAPLWQHLPASDGHVYAPQPHLQYSTAPQSCAAVFTPVLRWMESAASSGSAAMPLHSGQFHSTPLSSAGTATSSACRHSLWNTIGHV